MPKKSEAGPVFQTRLRIVADGEIALGPGKADLLEQIASTGSIADAVRNLDMSYIQARPPVKTMNAMFRAPRSSGPASRFQSVFSVVSRSTAG